MASGAERVGSLAVDGEAVDEAGVAARAREAGSAAPATIAADARVAHRHVVNVIDALRENGVERFPVQVGAPDHPSDSPGRVWYPREMRGLAPVATVAMLCIPTGCGLILDLDPDERAPDAGQPMDAAAVDARARADAAVEDAARGRDGSDACGDGGCPACVESGEVRLTETAVDEQWPRIARSGDGFVVAWETELGGTATVARWIGPDGRAAGPEWTVPAPARTPSLASVPGAVALGYGSGPQGHIQVFDAAGGSSRAVVFDTEGSTSQTDVTPDLVGWAMVWRETVSDGAHVGFRLFHADGTFRTAALAVSDGVFEPDEPDVAHLGGRYLVVWDENARSDLGEPNGRWASFREGRARTTGALGVDSDDASVAAGSDAFAAVWIEKSDGDVVAFQLFGPDGVPRGSPRLLTRDGEFRDEPAVAWNGAAWGVVFEEGTAGETDGVIRLLAVSADGTVLGEHQVSHGAAYAEKAELAWAAGGWGVVWQDVRDGNVEIYYAHLCP